MSDRVRTTISVDVEVLDVFKRLADMGGVSVGRFVGDWLADTADGAQHVAAELERAREASRGAIRDIHAKLGVRDVLDMIGDKDQPSAATGRMLDAQQPAAGSAQWLGRSAAPSSNTGLKSPRAKKKAVEGNT